MASKKLIVISIVVSGLAYMVTNKLMKEPPLPALDLDPWWGPGEPQPEDTTIKSFKINISKEDVADLQVRLGLPLRLTPPLENANFTYGMSHDTLKKLISYWKNSYDWRQREKRLNQYPHFKTRIEGLDIHFIRAEPQVRAGSKIKVLPLLMVHGWPGSIVEFYNILPLLTTPQEGSNVVFDVICPSLPGFGFSQNSHKQGLGQLETAQIFLKLMKRLGFEKFYLQGGDWGSLVTNLMATIYPENTMGVHLNMVVSQTLGVTIKMLLGSVLPADIIIAKEDQHKLYPLGDLFKKLLRESGYYHIQATKPDTVGAALNQSPVGLAAYIVEKFSTWTHVDNTHLPEGGLMEEDFPIALDELLDNVCLYWFTGTITSSMRYYAENTARRRVLHEMEKIPCRVPAGLSAFPDEILVLPKNLAAHKFYDIVTYTDQPVGGHFAAMEQPHLLARDVHKFVNAVEKRKLA